MQQCGRCVRLETLSCKDEDKKITVEIGDKSLLRCPHKMLKITHHDESHFHFLKDFPN